MAQTRNTGKAGTFLTKCLALVLFTFIYCNSVFASHIIGGDLTVRRVSANNYEITLTFYRNCGSSTGFESKIYVGVYNKGTNAQQQIVGINRTSITPLTLGDACYTPNLCIEKGLYRTTTNVVLPNNASGYYFSWLRCCRTASIANITSPGNEGYIFYAEICDPAIANSTPVFNSSLTPDGYMCRGFQNYDNFNATDADGDRLVYSFAAPLTCNATGQCNGTNNVAPSTSTGNLPDPLPNPPTYGSITWSGAYSLTNILGDASMSISSTGMISCIPPTLGVFVLSVVVEEWRVISSVDTKIGEIRRDFQFEVLACKNINIVTNPGNPICYGNTATISATGAPSGYTYSWSTSPVQTTSAIVVSPTTTGTMNYTVTATNGSCTSIVPVALVVNSSPTATVSYSGAFCTGGATTLTASGGTTYSWSNGSTSAVLTGSTNSTYSVWATNSLGCTSSSPATGSTIQPIPVGATYTWTGGGVTTSGNWFDSNNWGNAGGCIPTCSNNVVIPSTAGLPVTNPPRIDASAIAACKSITIANGNTLYFSNGTSELDVCGDWIQNGAVSMGSNGKVKFIGTVAQNFYKYSTATGDLNNVELANTASGTSATLTVKEGQTTPNSTATAYQDLTLETSGVFTFTTGMLVTQGGKKLVIKNTSGSAITGHGTSRYVFGKVTRYVASGSNYDFPVGSNHVGTTVYPYELMNIDFTSVPANSYFTVSFENPANAAFAYSPSYGGGLPLSEMGGSYTDLVDHGGTNTGVGIAGPTGGVWTIVPKDGTSTDYGMSVTYNMTLYGTNYDNAGSASNTIVKRNTFCSAPWALPGTYVSSSVAGNTVIVNRSGISGFSQAAIAKNIIALPVELLSFDAMCEKYNIQLTWETGSETNNDYFTLERSCDENVLQYQTIATIPGAGNSGSVKKYSYTDHDATAGNCYYRLSQTDYNGSTHVFAPVSINCKENADFNFIGVFPNPADDDVVILFASDNTAPVAMEFTDLAGQVLATKEIIPEIGLNKIKLSLNSVSSGLYFVKLNNGKKSFVKKLVKKT